MNNTNYTVRSKNRIVVKDIKHLEFLALNSKEIIEKQVDSNRQHHSYAGTIIGAIALFISFFLSSMDNTSQLVQYLLVIPITLFIIAILLLLSIFRTKPLDQALNVTKFKKLMNKSLEEILIYEIETNAQSYTVNSIITKKGNKKYADGMKLATLALLISIVLMISNKFINIHKKPAHIEFVNPLNGFIK